MTDILTITDKAAEKVRELMSKEPGIVGLKLGTSKRGCSGLAYTFDPVKEADPRDAVVEVTGGVIFVDADSLAYLKGTVMDFADDMFQSGFTFRNPNATGSCGCGESFTV